MMPTKTKLTEEQVMRFCSTEQNSGYDLSKPFRKGDKCYATDGGALLEFDGDYDVREKTPDVVSFITDANWPKSFGELPPLEPVPDGLDQPELYRTFRECAVCNGRATCVCECGDEHECCVCNGERGKVDICEVGYKPIRVCGANFRQHYLWAIDDLPGSEIARVGEGAEAKLLFRFDGGRGLVLPVVRGWKVCE